MRGVEKPDRLLPLELGRLSLDLAFLDFASDFIFAACHLLTISDPSLSFWYGRSIRGSNNRAIKVGCGDRVHGAFSDGSRVGDTLACGDGSRGCGDTGACGDGCHGVGDGGSSSREMFMVVVMFEVVLVVVVMALVILEPLVMAEPEVTTPPVKME